MKKFIVFIITAFMIAPSFAETDRFSAEYLKTKKHLSIVNPIAESFIQKTIKKALKKQTNQNYNVKFDGYNLVSMKKGIFKYLEISGKDITIEGIEVPYLKLHSVTDYNYIDYKQKPPAIMSDMTYAYEIHLSETSVNQALDDKNYKEQLEKVNSIAYPLFVINDVTIKIKNNKIYLIMEYNFPISPMKTNKNFVASTGFKILNNKILANDVSIDRSYGNLQAGKVANLINLLDPLTFTLSVIDNKKCNGKIENIKIVDNIIQISGKIYVKGGKCDR